MSQAKPFEVDSLDLKRRLVSGGAVALVAQAAKFVVVFVSTIVLARLLTPEDFGLVGMVTSVAAFFLLIRDLGLGTAVIQAEEIDNRKVSDVFWLNLVFCSSCAAVLALLAPLIARFFGRSELIGIALVMAGLMLIGGTSALHRALLIRQMRFKLIAVIDITAVVISVATAISAALATQSYWAIVAGHVALGVSGTIGTWALAGWCPMSPRIRLANNRSLVNVGGNLVAFQVVNYFARNLDKILIGAKFGSIPLGFYTRSYALSMLPIEQINNPIGSVTTPALCRLQNQPERFKKYYLSVLLIICHLVMPLAGLMFILPNEIVHVFFGEKWLNSVPILRWLALSMFAQVICHSTSWILVSLGQTSRLFYWGLFASSVIVIAFFLGLRFGPTGVALAYACAMFILVIPCVWYATLPTSINVLDVVKATTRPLAAVLFSVLACVMVRNMLSNLAQSGLNLALLVTAFATVYLAFSLVLNYREGKQLTVYAYSMVRN